MPPKKTIKRKIAKKLVWHFPSVDGGYHQGFVDPLQEFFQDMPHEWYVAREAIQNSIDARLDKADPVVVDFELFDTETGKLPGVSELRTVMAACRDFTKQQHDGKALEFFSGAVSLMKKKNIKVLRISDYNTLGLTGTDDDYEGRWYKLVKSIGTSNFTGPGGGSFGIGKGAPIAASALRTVFYSTVNDKGESAFQGVCRLSTHTNKKGDLRRESGFLGLGHGKSVRGASAIPKEFRRDGRGTNVYVVAYESDKDWKGPLLKSVLNNFWLAIYKKELIVSFLDGSEKKLIDHKSLKAFLEEYSFDEALPYYLSVSNPTKEFTKDLPELGVCSLFVRKQDGFPKRVAWSRMPKMVVRTREYRSLRDPYAGVFLCDNKAGNMLLRHLEPPNHDDWHPNRGDDLRIANRALRGLTDFISESLRSLAEDESGDPEDIPGLDRYLPESDDIGQPDQSQDELVEPRRDEERDDDAAPEIGAESEEIVEISRPAKTRPASVSRAGSGTITGRKGKNKGKGGGSADGKSGDDEGQEEGRLNTSAITFRGYARKIQGDETEYVFVIRSTEMVTGSVRIIAVGDDGEYPMPVSSARDLTRDKSLDVSGAFVRGIALEEKGALKVGVRITAANRYALGIEAYED